MGSLEDALRRSGLVSKKQAKQARHQKRVHRTEVGREGLEAERREKDRAHREQLEKQKEADRHLEAERAEKEAAERAHRAAPGRTGPEPTGRTGLASQESDFGGLGSTDGSGSDSARGTARGTHSGGAATRATIADRVYRGTLGRTGGPKQYFFVLPGGQIRYLEVNDETFRRLQDGGAGIVLVPTPEGDATQTPVRFVIVDRATALQVRSIIPDGLIELQSERAFGSTR